MFAPVQDPLTSLEDIIRGLMTSKLDLFVGMGQNLFRGFATILIAWFGVQSALSSAEGGEGFNFARFSRLLLVIAFGFAMVKYYSTPIPGFGMSFPDLVMQEASSLSNSIGMDQARLIETKVTEVEQGMEQPSAINFHETLTFVVLYVILATVQAVVLMIIGFGLIAQAVLLLVGPVFIPFFVVPKMDWLFWGWFKAFLQYSFYQVVATLGYKPQDAEIKYFLSDFCRLYYSRNRYTVRDNFKKSLLFMEAQLANSVAEAYRKNHTVEAISRTPVPQTSTLT